MTDAQSVEAVAKPLFWRKAEDHPQDWTGELIAFGLGGRYAIRTDNYGAHVWWPEDEYTFTTYPDTAAAKVAAEEHWQTEFAKRLKPDWAERGFIPPYISKALAAMPATPTDQEATAQYLVWSNEHRAWWGRDRCGYTRIIANAGRYDRAEALSIAGMRDGGWRLNKGNPDEIAIPEQDAIDQYADITREQEAEARQNGGVS